MTAPLPPNEGARLEALERYAILDTPEEQIFDDVARLAAGICRTPIALISFVDRDRQWFKAHIGLDLTQTPRDQAFCAHALLHSDEVLVVPDATADARFASSTLVTGAERIRFYAGAPLVTPDRQALGAMCVMDRRPRRLDKAQLAGLRVLAGIVTRQLELRRALDESRRLAEQQEEIQARLEAAGRERAEALARQTATERWARLVVDTALDAVVVVDQTAQVTFWNAQAEATFGWTREEAIGSPLTELIIPMRLREAHAAGMRRYLATGEARVLNQRIEVPARHKDGREFPVELTITPIKEGDTLTFSAFLRDISAPKREQRLLESQYTLGQVLRESTSVAEAAPRVLETIGAFLGWDAAALWTANDAGELQCVSHWVRPGFDATRFSDETRTITFRAGEGLPGRVLRSGEPVWISDVTAADFFVRADAAGQAGLAAGVALPILTTAGVAGVVEFYRRGALIPDREVINTLTSLMRHIGQFVERVQGIEALRRSENRTRAVIENMLEGLVVVGADLKVVDANEAFARMFAYERSELIGMPITRLMPERPEYQDVDRLTQTYRQAVNRLTEHEGRRRNGALFPLTLQAYEIDTPEGVLTAANVRDLSQEREASRLKGHFVASVSHELRTPLTSIRGALGLLLADTTGLLSDRARSMIEMADRNAARLSGLINDLLDFERLQLGMLSLAHETFPLDQAVERAIEAITGLVRGAGITIDAPQTHLTVHADEGRVVQVLVNLLSNAIKFSPAGSRIAVSGRRLDNVVEIRISDAGRGVPVELQNVIFEPFRQVEESDSRRRQGTGLGLAICRAVVRQHGGDIGVECPASGGSIFWFTLPERREAAPVL